MDLPTFKASVLDPIENRPWFTRISRPSSPHVTPPTPPHAPPLRPRLADRNLLPGLGRQAGPSQRQAARRCTGGAPGGAACARRHDGRSRLRRAVRRAPMAATTRRAQRPAGNWVACARRHAGRSGQRQTEPPAGSEAALRTEPPAERWRSGRMVAARSWSDVGRVFNSTSPINTKYRIKNSNKFK